MGNLEIGTLVLIIGMGTVFAVLIILWGVLEFMKKIFGKRAVTSSNAEKVLQAASDKLIINDNADYTMTADKTEEEELIAVFTAAIAASLNTSTYNLNVKSFRRVRENLPIWNSASRIENIENSL